MLNSLMYRLTYYRYAEAAEALVGRRGYDRVRQATIGVQDFSLKSFEEARGGGGGGVAALWVWGAIGGWVWGGNGGV